MAGPSEAEQLNQATEAPWITTLRGLGQRALENNPFMLPYNAVKSLASDPATQTYLSNAAQYLKDTDWRAAGEGMLRASPFLKPAFAVKDYQEGNLGENLRYEYGQKSQIPTDVVSSATNIIPLVSKVSGLTGGPTLPESVTAPMTNAAANVSEFGKSYGDVIAGRPIYDDVLRGTPAQMGSTWERYLLGSAIPISPKITNPITSTIMSGVDKLTRGSELAANATRAAGRTLEVLSPLAIGEGRSVVPANLGAATVTTPVMEAVGEAEKIKQERERLDKEAKAGETLAVQGGQEAGVVKPTVPFGRDSSDPRTGISDQAADTIGTEIKKQTNATLAGVPSTGSTTGDVALGIVGAALLLRYKRRVGDMVAGAIQRSPTLTEKLTGYDPSKPADKTYQTLTTQMAQQRSSGYESMGESLRRAAGEVYPQNRVGRTMADDLADKFQNDTARATGAPLSHRKELFNRTGEWMDTNIKSRMPWDDYELRVSKYSPEDRIDHNKLLWYEQELDTRARIWNLNVTQNRPNTHVRNYGYNFYDTPSADLAREIQRIRSTKPDIVTNVDGWRGMVRDGTNYGVQRWRFEPQEGSKFLNNNPKYVPPTNVPPGGSLLNDRDIVSNWNQGAGTSIPRGVKTLEELGDPLPAQKRYIDELFRSTEGMARKRAFVQDMTTLKTMGSRHASDVLGRPGPLGLDAKDRVVTYRDAYGKKKSIEINDAVVRDAMKGVGNPTALQMVSGAMQQATRFAQSGMVGPMSLVNPTFFPIDSIAYQSASAASFSRPRGVSAGLLDKALRKSGVEFGLPGDPTFQLLSYGQGVMNVGAMFLDRLARGLHNSIITDGFLARNMSRAWLQTAADNMEKWYTKTGLHYMQESGLMGPGQAGANQASRLNMAGQPTATSAIAQGVHNITGMNLPGIIKDPVQGMKSGYSFVDGIMHAMSSGPSVLTTKFNKNLLADPTQAWKVEAFIRNSSGDPGKSGAFRSAGNKTGISKEADFLAATPFGNVTYQQLSRLWESARRDPMRLAVGVYMTVILPQQMATLWNSSNGPEYTDYEFNQRSASKIASHIYVARPGLSPQEGWEFAVEPGFRVFKWAGQALAGLYFGIFNGEIHKEGNTDLRLAKDEMIWHREAPSFDQGNVFREAVSQSLLPSPVPAAAAVVGYYGGKLDSYLDLANPQVAKESKDQGFIEGAQTNPAGQKVFGVNLPAHTEEILNALGGSGLKTAYNMVTGIRRDVSGDPGTGTPPKSFGEAVNYQAQGWAQRAGDTTIGQLFGTRRPLYPGQEASAFVVKEKLATLKEITDAFNASTQKGSPREFGTRNTGKEAPIGVGARAPQDVDTARFAYDAKNVLAGMSQYKEELNLAYKQYGSVKADNTIPMDRKRILMEEQAQRVINTNRRMLQDLQRQEAALSVKYGVPISFDKYDKDKPFSQQDWKPRWAEQLK